MNRRLLRLGVVSAGLALLITGGSASAQDAELDPATLDELSALAPPANSPDAEDNDSAQQRFDQMAEIVAGSSVSTNSSSKLEGSCGGYAYSYDEDGVLVDAAMALGDGAPIIDIIDGGQAFTSDNPFKVDTAGSVQYFGFMPRSGEGPMNHTWWIETSGIRLGEGGDPNSNGNNRNAGVVDLGEEVPFEFSARMPASGRLDSANAGSCVGEGHVEFQGNGLTDPLGLAGIAILALGAAGLIFNARPARTWKGMP